MRGAGTSLGESLVQGGLLKSEQLEKVQSEVRRTQESFHKVLQRLRLVDEKRLTSFLSSKFNIPEVEITHQIIKPEILKLIPEHLVRKFSVFPLRKIGKRLVIAMSDPLNLNAVDQLRLQSGYDIEPRLATDSEIRSAIEQYYGMKSEMSGVLETLRSESSLKTAGTVKRERTVEEGPVMSLVNTMIGQAVREGASDVHIAPEKDKVIVRYRVDGVLHQVDEYPLASHPSVVSRIKVMANLDISENRVPQDGRVQMEVSHHQVDLRISVMPTIHGENLVIRLLNLQSAVMTLEELGLSKEDLKTFKTMISKPYGILLLTGPTGSGKTTTLYAILNQINSPGKNIVTIEDPVEYQLPLIRQIQVNPKVHLTFANGLRSILRQDPDVIMVGEIRDRETAEIATQAALTGHLVLSTLHTNDAASAMTRLTDMGIEPFLVASTVTGVIAQRLIRTICKECRTSFQADRESLAKLSLVSGGMPVDVETKLYRGNGCLYCKKSGYRGRSGIFELLVSTDEVKKLVLQKASSHDIAAKAVEKGMKALRRDGFEKILAGVATVEEVLRVTEEI